ncbi:MAG: dethiobiotin synthase [Alphaproteobacteria bacterium]
MNKNSFFITGTDTGVGKTLVSAILAKKYNAHYYKPIQCGLNRNGDKDSDIVLNIFKDVSVIKETYFFKNSLSPNIAAKKENVNIEISQFLKVDKIDYPIVIEGAGGLQVPIDEKILMSDLISHFNLPTILVSRTQLGTINHTLMSIDIIKKKKINLAGIIFSGDENKETIGTIMRFGEKIYGKEINLISIIPFLKTINSDNLQQIVLNLKT